MNLKKLRTLIYDYIQLRTGHNRASTTPNGLNVVDVAINEARKSVELANDLKLSFARVSLTVAPSTGGDLRYCRLLGMETPLPDVTFTGKLTLSSGVLVLSPDIVDLPQWSEKASLGYDTLSVTCSTLHWTDVVVRLDGVTKAAAVGRVEDILLTAAAASCTFTLRRDQPTMVSVKKVVAAYLNGYPVSIDQQDNLNNRWFEAEDRRDTFYREPRDGEPERRNPYDTLRQVGGVIYSGRKDSVELTLDVLRWMPEYERDEDTDFIMTHGSNYLKWEALVNLNHIWEVWVPRQEGSLPPPTRERDKALEEFLTWDAYYDVTAHYPYKR